MVAVTSTTQGENKDMPIALTVLNPGTGFLRDHTDVVGEMSRDISGIEEEDWIVTAGVAARGAIKFPRTRPGEIDITRAQPGMLDPLTWSSTKAQLPDDRKHFPAIQQNYDLGGARKIGFGAFGMEHNVIRAVHWIERQVNYALRDRQPPPKVLNMIGWSRGAFTCLRIADELQKYAMFSSKTPELQATTNEMRDASEYFRH